MRAARLRIGLLAATAAAFSLGLPPAWADDSDIFLRDPVPPNVVILLDSSGSMGSRPSSGSSSSKMTIAKQAVTNLINNVEGVNFGVFKFNKYNDGGFMIAPIGTPKADIIADVNAISPAGGTPLGRALRDVQLYFLGEYDDGGSYAGGGNGQDKSDEKDDRRKCSDGSSGKKPKKGDEDEDDDRYDCDEPVKDPSPILYECQLNYVIVVTDGMPNGEDEDLVTQIAEDMFETDHSSLPGMQNVVVHTIGFDVPEGTALLTATAQAGGGSFFTATNSAQLENALQNAIQRVVDDAYRFAAPLVPSTSASGGSNAYLASFEPFSSRPFWKGHLEAYQRDAYGKIPVDARGIPLISARVWDAGAQLAAKSAASRTIYTVVGTTRYSFVTGTSQITQALLAVASSTERTKLINFIRGVDTYDHDTDGNTTEERAWKLGDVFHSAPVLVFPPPLDSSEAGYAAFKSAQENRTTIVLAGANDGMLHAFRASDGEELWGFIPPDLLDDLKNLTPTVGAHPFFVDSSPVVADVKIGGAWKTIAVFGQRRGGRNVYALDITDTTNPLYLWGFTSVRMGETWSIPAIGKVKLASGDAWVAFVGGGYNSTSNNTTGKTFMVIDLSNGQKLWEYYNTGVADAAKMNFSLAAPPTAVDLDLDGYIDRVYTGDVGGQLWKFDVSAVGTVSDGVVTNWTGKRLFAAAPTQANPPPAGAYYPAQAIYGAPALALDAYENLWVYFGTGDRNNPNRASQNRFYAIKDDTTMANNAALTEASLVDISSSNPAVSQGWYLRLADTEKVLGGAKVFAKTVYFTTFTPAAVDDVCQSEHGDARLYAVKMGNGHSARDWASDEERTTTDGTEERSELVGSGISSDPSVTMVGGDALLTVATTNEEVTHEDLPGDGGVRLRYWREVY